MSFVFVRALAASATLGIIVLGGVGCGAPSDASTTAADGDDGGNGGTTCTVSPTFSSIRTRLLASASCAVSGCHATPGQAGLSFDGDPEVVYQALVGATSHTSTLKRVAPSAPDDSFLFLKVSEDTPPTGARMPEGRKALSACDVAAIRAWIAAGAQKD